MKKTPLLLFVLILIPVLLLTWYSFRLEKQQQLLLGHQLNGLIETQLLEIDQQLQGHFQRMEEGLDAEAKELYKQKDGSYSHRSLRTLVAGSPYIDQVFVLNKQRELVYPSLNDSSMQDKAFLNQYQPLLKRSDLFSSKAESESDKPQRLTPDDSAAVSAQLQTSPLVPKLEIASRKALSAPSYSEGLPESASADRINEPLAVKKISGWIAWHQGAQLQHIYWLEDKAGEVMGFKLNSSRLFSDLLNLLPDQSESSDNPALTNSAIRLVNNVGEVVFEWGDLEEIAEQLSPLDSLSLSHPMGSWHLEFYSPSLQAPSNNWAEKIVIVLALVVFLGVTAWLVYREQTRAARLAEQRVNFVNQVSHELKTPLTNVRMYTEMLEHRLDEQDQLQRRYLGVINSESLRLTRLIDNVLSFSKIGRGVDVIAPEAGMLCHPIQRVIESFQPAFEQRHLKVELEDRCHSEAFFDQHAVEQILNNLLSNCEKYASDSGNVLITCSEDVSLGYSYITVQDFGPGIPSSDCKNIFAPFYRVSNQLTDGVSGTGIGLSIARSLARAHGGDLSLESTDLGACFKLSLPIRRNAG
ncbi:MAG: sensor histidine kinase [Neptuniibacter sp.]